MPKVLHESLINNVDDSAPVDEITVNAFSTFSKLFPQAGYNPSDMKPGQIPDKDISTDSSKPEYEGFEYAWSGIIGVVSTTSSFGVTCSSVSDWRYTLCENKTTDSVPFIGEIPGKAGQFIGAGFNGHGMSQGSI
jgi:hypothetical protein